jgi:hypothetical protein
MLATVACLKGHKWKSMMIKVALIRMANVQRLIYCSAYILATGFETTRRYHICPRIYANPADEL